MKRETQKAAESNKDAVRWADAALSVNDEMGKVIATMTDTPTPDLTAPERIWAWDDMPTGRWSAHENTHYHKLPTEYTRADIPAARIAELESEVARLRATIGEAHNAMEDGCDADAWAVLRDARADLRKG